MTSQWMNSLWDILPAEDCMMACCCPCVMMGKTAHRMNDPSMEGYSTFNNDCFMAYCLGCFWTCVKRGEIREKYDIEGSSGKDFCTSYWCSLCAMIQHDKEVKSRQAGGGPVTQGYQAQKEGMHMPQNGQNGHNGQHQQPPMQHQVPPQQGDAAFNQQEAGYAGGVPPTHGH